MMYMRSFAPFQLYSGVFLTYCKSTRAGPKQTNNMFGIALLAFRYPDAFHAVHFNLGIRDVIAFLISWDLLLWDPLFASEYWDLTTSQMVPATLKLKGLRWYSSVLDYVTKLESAFSGM